MSNINKQALREAAEKAVSEGEGSWQAWHEAGQKYPEVFTSSGHLVATVNGSFGVSRSNFIAAANPATVLALLDEIAELEQRHCGTALLEREEMHTKTLGRMLDELDAKDRRIAELELKLEAADKLQDSAFRHGLQHGFSYGQTDNQAGFEQAIQAYGQQWKGE